MREAVLVGQFTKNDPPSAAELKQYADNKDPGPTITGPTNFALGSICELVVPSDGPLASSPS